MKSMRVLLLVASLFGASTSFGAEWLMKLARWEQPAQLQNRLRVAGQNVISIEDLRFGGWYLIRTATEAWTPFEANSIGSKAQAVWVERNKKIRVKFNNPPRLDQPSAPAAADPEFQVIPPRGAGPDPMLNQQWGLVDTGFMNVKNAAGNPKVVVAVIDTGVDYNHPDLNGAIWMNPGEAGPLAHNGIDDDHNGYVDDYMGWDFAENDNKPFDRTSFFGNPGHGTHCSGVIGATAGNGYGIAGIASGVRIMPLRFLPENGEGTTANAVKAIKYAIDNGAWIMSNSWGGEDEQNDDARALREIFVEAANKGRIMVVAAGNESANVDAAPLKATPASFNAPTQITVAATGKGGSMASFSNFGATLVHLGAPGVGIYSTVPGGRFQNMDGTSMATPMVAGATALFWSAHPTMNAMDVKKAVLSSVKPTQALGGRTTTGGRLDIEALMKVSLAPGFRRF